MKFFIYLGLIFLSSCSSLKRQKLLGAAIGSVAMSQVGQNVGNSLTPDEESKKLNQTIGLAIGAGIGFLVGGHTAGIFWDEKKEMKTSINFMQEAEIHYQKPQVKILNPKNVKKIKLENDLPSFLKGKVKKASVFTYEIEAYEEETEGNRKIYHEPHKAYEYILE